MKMWGMKITAAAAQAGSGLCRALLSCSLTAGFNRYSKIGKQDKQREGGRRAHSDGKNTITETLSEEV